MEHKLIGIKNLSEQAQKSIENVLYSNKPVLSQNQKTELAIAKALVQQIHQLVLEVEQENRSLKNDQACIENLSRRI